MTEDNNTADQQPEEIKPKLKRGKPRSPGDAPDWRSKNRKALAQKKTCIISARCTALEAKQIKEIAAHYELSMTDLVIHAVRNYAPSKDIKSLRPVGISTDRG